MYEIWIFDGRVNKWLYRISLNKHNSWSHLFRFFEWISSTLHASKHIALLQKHKWGCPIDALEFVDVVSIGIVSVAMRHLVCWKSKAKEDLNQSFPLWTQSTINLIMSAWHNLTVRDHPWRIIKLHTELVNWDLFLPLMNTNTLLFSFIGIYSKGKNIEFNKYYGNNIDKDILKVTSTFKKTCVYTGKKGLGKENRDTGAELTNVTALAFEQANWETDGHIKSASIPLIFKQLHHCTVVWEEGKNTSSKTLVSQD